MSEPRLSWPTRLQSWLWTHGHYRLFHIVDRIFPDRV